VPGVARRLAAVTIMCATVERRQQSLATLSTQSVIIFAGTVLEHENGDRKGTLNIEKS